MAAKNETTERPSATLVYDMITIIRLIAISQSWFLGRQKMLAIWMEAEALARTTGNVT